MKQRMIETSITMKGWALLAAEESGLLPKTEGGRDITAFEKFWGAFEDSLRKQGFDPCADFMKVLNEKGGKGAKRNKKYLEYAVAFLLGCRLGDFLISLIELLRKP